jgi:cytochrome c1
MSPRRSRIAALIAPLALALCGLAACAPEAKPAYTALGGDPERGADLMIQAQCGACHRIPGIENAQGLVGPPLDAFGRRTMIAGLLPNTPDNLVRWVRDPQSVVPGNAMPSNNFDDQQARDVAAYLYTLR